MNNYRYLNLPNNPLRDIDFFIEKNHKKSSLQDQYGIESKEVLTDEILQILFQTGLSVDFVVVFKTYNSLGDSKHRLIHTDIKWEDARWKKISFGINWEISDRIESTFQWWDMSAYPEVFPPPEQENRGVFSKLCGIHYRQRSICGVPAESVLLEKADLLSGATLVRTDIPHSIIYKGFKRMSISIRFKENISWNDAVELFKPLTV